MSLSIYTLRLLGLAQTLHRWLAMLTGLDRVNRERVADYADAIAATMARASSAMARLDAKPGDAAARADALRELGRINGYVETIVAVLEAHLDGRKIAGLKKRLDQLGVRRLALSVSDPTSPGSSKAPSGQGQMRADRLLTAEGYLRALADGLRA